MFLLVLGLIVATLGLLWRHWAHPSVSHVRHSPLALLTAGALAVVASQVSQIWIIATDTGRIPMTPAGDGTLATLWAYRGAIGLEVGWYAYLALMAALFGSLMVGGAVEEGSLPAWGRAATLPRLARRALEAMERGSAWLIRKPALTVPLILVVFALSWGELLPDPVLGALGWDREGINAFAMLLVFALVTTVVAEWVDRVPDRPPSARALDRAWTLTSNGLLLMVAVNEAVWVEATSGGLISGRNHFVTALMSVGFAGVALAYLIDRTRGMDVRPSAVVLVPAAFLVVVTSWDSWVGHETRTEDAAPPVTCSATEDAQRREAASLRWLESVDARLSRIPPEGPVFVVAASGGGTRAAIYTTLTLAWMKASKVQCEDAPKPPLPAVPAPLLPFEQRGDRPDRVQFLAADNVGMDQHILLISSVSGGSLGSAYYWSHPEEFTLRQAPCDDADIRHIAASWVVPTYRSLRDEADSHALDAQRRLVAEERVRTATRESLRKAGGAFIEESLEAWMHSPQARQGVERELARLLHASPTSEATPYPLAGFPSASETFQPIGERAVCSTFLDKVGQNFASPTVRGSLLPFASRGDELEKAWIGGNLLRRNVTGSQPDAASPDRPLLMLNAFDVRTGGSVVVGMPALPPWLLHATPDDTPNGYALPPIAPLDVAEGMDPSLAKAVRASAAVPLLFDPVRVRSACAPDPNAPTASEATLTVLDGGAYDNTGIDTLDALLPMLTDKARQERFVFDAFNSDEERARARELLEKIRAGIASRGGPILVEVDSSARPAPYSDNVNDSETATFARPGSDVLLGWEAFSRATFQHARAATLSMVSDLAPAKALAGDTPRRWPPVDQVPDGIVRLVYAPDVLDKPGHDVMSFWALGPTDIAYLLYAFDHTRITAEADMEREVQTACDAGLDFRLREAKAREEARARHAPAPPARVLVASCSDADAPLVAKVGARLATIAGPDKLNLAIDTTRLSPEVAEPLRMADAHQVRAALDESMLAGAIALHLAEIEPTASWPIGLRAPSWEPALTVVVCGARTPVASPPATEPPPAPSTPPPSTPEVPAGAPQSTGAAPRATRSGR